MVATGASVGVGVSVGIAVGSGVGVGVSVGVGVGVSVGVGVLVGSGVGVEVGGIVVGVGDGSGAFARSGAKMPGDPSALATAWKTLVKNPKEIRVRNRYPDSFFSIYSILS